MYVVKKMKIINSYIYAIKGTWMDMWKIGRYIADFQSLKRRYSTYYGTDLDIVIFECNLNDASEIEKKVHEHLKEYRFDKKSELFKSECLDFFLQYTSSLCFRYVNIPVKYSRSVTMMHPVIDLTNNNIQIKSKDNITKKKNKLTNKIIIDKQSLVRSKNTKIVESTRETIINNIQNTKNNEDCNPHILECSNGQIDLRSGELKNRENNKSNYMIKTEYLGINHNTHLVDSLMNDLFQSNKEIIDYLQILLGYAITGESCLHKFVIFNGKTGSNGKTILLTYLQNLLGDYLVNSVGNLFSKNTRKCDVNKPTPHIAALYKKRISVLDEIDSGIEFDITQIKYITGSDKLTARLLYQNNFIQFKNTCFHILSCNKIPKAMMDSAFFRRVIIIPFNSEFRTIDDAHKPYDCTNLCHKLRDENLLKKLSCPEALSQLLTWCVAGSVKYYEKGLSNYPDSIKNCLTEYINSCDVLTEFIETKCVIDKKYTVNCSLFRNTLLEFSELKLKQIELILKMEKKGFRYTKKNGRSYVGLKLIE